MYLPLGKSIMFWALSVTDLSYPLFLLNVSTALKGTHFDILFVVTAAGVVPCGSPTKRPRTSPIVQFIPSFGPLRSAEIF